MAIPTQFSVTSTRTSPIANPSAPQDIPQSLDAENVSIVDGAEVLSSLSSVTVDTPNALTSESGMTIPLPAELTAKVQAAIDNAVTIPAEAQAGINTPVEAAALPSVTIDNASALPAESVAAIATPSAATSESSAAITTPTAATSQAEAVITAPVAASVQPSAPTSTPSAATSESVAPIATPNTLTTIAGTPTTPPFPLNHARILYENTLQGYSSLSATNSDIGFDPINALKPNTFERWRFSTATSTFQVDFGGVAQDFDMLCIGAHNLGQAGATIEVWYEPEPGGTFFKFDGTKNPSLTENQPIAFYSQSSVSALTIEVRITGANSNVNIGYISAGIALQMQRPFFNGHTPITDGDATQYYSNRTESGEIIGQQIRRQGFETSADWQNLDDTWYRTYFTPFKQAAKTRPFFFAWNLLEYPDDVGFCRISQDISAPMQNGTVTKRSISMNLLGAG